MVYLPILPSALFLSYFIFPSYISSIVSFNCFRVKTRWFVWVRAGTIWLIWLVLYALEPTFGLSAWWEWCRDFESIGDEMSMFTFYPFVYFTNSCKYFLFYAYSWVISPKTSSLCFRSRFNSFSIRRYCPSDLLLFFGSECLMFMDERAISTIELTNLSCCVQSSQIRVRRSSERVEQNSRVGFFTSWYMENRTYWK